MPNISNEHRAQMETDIAVVIVRDALALGYTVSVDDGEEESARLDTKHAVMKEMFSTETDILRFFKKDQPSCAVLLVYGNDGYDVIADYTDNAATREILANAEQLSDELASNLN